VSKQSRKDFERAYFANIGDSGRRHAVAKPWSDENCGGLLQEIAPIFSLCPPPPARLLDIGCGAGWTSDLFARRGYDVTGVDISPDAIELASGTYARNNLRFLLHDFDDALDPTSEPFDIAVFFDSLHHSEDERRPLSFAYDALRQGGICIVCEPGTGHARAESSRHATETFHVTERDMPPRAVRAAALSAGFRSVTCYPHPQRFCVPLYRQISGHPSPKQRLLRRPMVAALRAFYAASAERRRWALMVLEK